MEMPRKSVPNMIRRAPSLSVAHGDDQAHVETTGKPSPDLVKHNGLKQALLATTLRDATLV
jgi:hypothetical protein